MKIKTVKIMGCAGCFVPQSDTCLVLEANKHLRMPNTKYNCCWDAPSGMPFDMTDLKTSVVLILFLTLPIWISELYSLLVRLF